MDYEKLQKDTINKLQQMVNSGKITVEIARGICADFVPESEDERIKDALLNFLNDELDKNGNEEWDWGFHTKDIIAWLKKQGEHHAWNKEDDDNMMMIEDRFSDYLDYIREDSSLTKHRKNSLKEEIIGYMNWFKSIKDRVQPQPQWKPSDEQMEALEFAADCIVPAEFCFKRKILKELLEQIKKL